MTDITPTAAETADLEARNQSTAGRLFIAADAFLFLGFLFAYLYLRALNNNDMWNPHGQNPSGPMGVVVLVLVVVTAALLHVGAGRLAVGRAGRVPRARRRGRRRRAGRDRARRGRSSSGPGSRPATRAASAASSSGSPRSTSCTWSAASTGSRRRSCSARARSCAATVPPCVLYWWFLAVVLAIFSVLFYLV